MRKRQNRAERTIALQKANCEAQKSQEKAACEALKAKLAAACAEHK
jgi:hypothetical protein